MDRVQVAALIEQEAALPSEKAAEVVKLLEARGVLVVGEPRHWTVTVDDPGAQRAYVYEDIEACSAYAASVEAARRTIREDPGATMPGEVGRLSPEQRAHIADGDVDGLVGIVARFAVAVEKTTAEVV